MFNSFLVVAAAVALGQAHEVKVPEEAIEHLKYLAGKWTAEGETGPLEFKGEYRAEWTTGKHCLVLHATWTSSERPTEHATAVCGWDAAKKQIVETWFYSGNSHSVFRCTIRAPSVLEGTLTGRESTGDDVIANIELLKTPDEFTWTATERIVGGRCEPDSVICFRRVKD
jgi:hypothetical protein